jgi:catechol 2,3-dioxygenase-like lactoylglutathione lyase family enzyme
MASSLVAPRIRLFRSGTGRARNGRQHGVDGAPDRRAVIVLQQFPISARAAAIDLDRARQWFREKLGLTPDQSDPGGHWYRFGADTWLYLYGTPSAGTAKNTIAGWAVKDIEAVMAGLRERGVAFEDYDFGEVRTVDGLVDFGGAKAAWFKDSEGNVYELTEVAG